VFLFHLHYYYYYKLLHSFYHHAPVYVPNLPMAVLGFSNHIITLFFGWLPLIYVHQYRYHDHYQYYDEGVILELLEPVSLLPPLLLTMVKD
jgi:hypothetical protein